MDRLGGRFRAIDSITLREQIVSELASGRKKFCIFFALFDRRALPSQINCSFGRP
jgi:hypothetical protein